MSRAGHDYVVSHLRSWNQINDKCQTSVDLLSNASCVCAVCVFVDVRDGRPGVFLRELCVPAERRDDEPVLHLRRLPQVTLLGRRPIMLQRASGVETRQLSEKQLCGFSCVRYRLIEDDLSGCVVTSRT